MGQWLHGCVQIQWFHFNLLQFHVVHGRLGRHEVHRRRRGRGRVLVLNHFHSRFLRHGMNRRDADRWRESFRRIVLVDMVDRMRVMHRRGSRPRRRWRRLGDFDDW